MTTEREIELYKEIIPISPSVELHGLINAARDRIQLEQPADYGINIPVEMGPFNLSLVPLLDKKPSERKAIIRKSITDAWNEIKKNLYNQIQSIPDQVANEVIDAIFKLLHEVVDQLIGPFDDQIIYVQCTYNDVIRLIRKLTDPTLEDERKASVINALMDALNNMAAQSPFIADIIALILLIENLKKVSATLKDLRSANEQNFDDTIKSGNATLMVLEQEALLASNIISMVVTALRLIIPLLGILGAVFCGGRQFDKSMAEAEEKYIKDEIDQQDKENKLVLPKLNSVIETYAKNNEKGFSYFKTQKENNQEQNEQRELRIGATLKRRTKGNVPPFEWESDLGEVFYTNTADIGKYEYYFNSDMVEKSGYCEISEKEDFGIKYKIATTIPEEEEYCHDIEYMDMCTDDTSGLGGTDNIGQSLNDLEDGEIQKAFIEFDPNETFIIHKAKGDYITYGDLIGYISGVPVYSEKEGTVNYISENYISISFPSKSGENVESENDRLVAQALSTDAQKSAVDEIIEKFNKLNKVKTIIRDYLGYLKLPYIPINDGVVINNSKTKYSKDVIYNNYKSELESKTETYQNKVKTITGRDHIESMLNANNMDGLEKEILTEDSRFYTDIINHFRTYIKNNSLVCDGDELSNYLLLTDYEEIFDSISYDEENEYLMELVNILETFIIERRAYEGVGKSAYIKSFNDFCDKSLKSKWTFDETYYDYFSRIYKTYEFTMTSTNPSDVKENYKKLYNFLTNLMGCTEDSQKVYEFTSLEDLQNMNQDATSYVDTDNLEKRETAKKICRRFFLVKDMEEYTEDNANGSKDRLTKITTNEKDTINTYAEKIISTYLDLKDIVDGKCFDVFKQGVFNKRTNVYYNDIQHEHYFITDSDHIPEFDYSGEPPDYLMEELDSEASPKTRVPVSKLPYWLLYCLQATLVHCMLPFYWPCGIMIAGAPLPLPVIYIPIYFLNGPVSVLFGLAICGVFIYPMIVTINFTIDTKCVITFINSILAMIRNNLDMIMDNMKLSMKDMIKLKIDELEKSSEDLNKQIQDIDIQISDTEEQIIFYGLQKEEIKKKRKNKKGGS